MNKNRTLKEAKVAEIKEKLEKAQGVALANYQGLTVEEDTMLRKSLREAGVEYTVIKNTLARFAANEVGLGELSDVFNGTTAIATHKEDVVAPAKVLSEFIDANKEAAGIEIKAGFVEGKVVALEEIKAMAKVPSKETLYAMLAGGLNATIAGLARAINAVKEKQEAEA